MGSSLAPWPWAFNDPLFAECFSAVLEGIPGESLCEASDLPHAMAAGVSVAWASLEGSSGVVGALWVHACGFCRQHK